MSATHLPVKYRPARYGRVSYGPNAGHARSVAIADGRRHDLLSRADRLAAFFLRGRTATLRNPHPLVSFTFDDVAASACDNGAAILEEHGARGTFYVAGGLCGRRHPMWTFADKEMVRAVAASGHEIGCHTYAHPDVQQTAGAELTHDLHANRRFLEGLDIGPPHNFAYPYGSVGLGQKALIAEHFVSCRGVREGINAGRADLAHLRAVRLYDATITAERIEALLRQTVAERGWLIFYTHDVRDPQSAEGTSTALFRRAVAAAAHHCAIVTVGEALHRAGVTDEKAYAGAGRR